MFAPTWLDAGLRWRRIALDNHPVLVKEPHLTDLYLFTEVHYTRYFSQADWRRRCDYPAARKRFPAGLLRSSPDDNLADTPTLPD